MAPVVLVTGGSGYLGQFLVQDLAAAGYKVVFTYHSAAAPTFDGQVEAFRVDLASGEGLQRGLATLGPSLVAVINTAAISQPGVCEKEPERARAVNVPSKLVDSLEQYRAQYGSEPLLIHLSTDQVYEGSKSFWKETDECHPVNAYGRSKLEAEQAVEQRWPRHAILRSSIIYGPEPPAAPVGRALFLQFVDSALASQKPTTFFEDEWRCPIYVADICRICRALIDRDQRQAPPAGVLNMGGPDRLSRVDMAYAVAAARGHGAASIVPAPASSVPRGVVSPADISMNSSKLAGLLGLQLTPFTEALPAVFGTVAL